MDAKRIERFTEIVQLLKHEAVIYEEVIQGFRIEAQQMPFAGAGEISKVSGVKTSFANAYKKYADPYEYLRELVADATLPRSDLYKLFAKINYRVLNKDGFTKRSLRGAAIADVMKRGARVGPDPREFAVIVSALAS